MGVELYEDFVSFTEEEVGKFAEISGDFNPLHLDEEFAISQGFKGKIVHGAFMISKVSAIIATKFPGPGTIIGSVEWKFILPILINEKVLVKCTLTKNESRKAVLEVQILNEAGSIVQESKIILFLQR